MVASVSYLQDLVHIHDAGVSQQTGPRTVAATTRFQNLFGNCANSLIQFNGKLEQRLLSRCQAGLA